VDINLLKAELKRNKMQQPKPKKIIKQTVKSLVKGGIANDKATKNFANKEINKYSPTKEDIELSKRSGVSIEDIMAQGGATPSSVIKQIKEQRAYDVKYGPGLYKKPIKKVVPKK